MACRGSSPAYCDCSCFCFALVLRAKQYHGMQGVQFSVVVTEGRPDATGLTMANALSKMKIPCTIVLDSAVAFALEALK